MEGLYVWCTQYLERAEKIKEYMKKSNKSIINKTIKRFRPKGKGKSGRGGESVKAK
jgi:hypothetical protein